MLKSTNKTGTNAYELEVSISAEVFEDAIVKAYNKQKKNISVPGFRKGKATRHMIESLYGKGVFYEDALETVYPDAVESALKESELKVVDYNVEVKEMGQNGVELLVKVTVKPEDIEVGEYKGLEAVKAESVVTDEEVDAEINRLLDRNSRIITVEDRAAQNGDIAVIDFEGFVDGKAFEGGKGENHSLTLGSGQFIPGFEDQIIGHNVNDEFEVNVTFPEDYAPELAAKEAVFKVKIHEIKFKELPELDDDFAKEDMLRHKEEHAQTDFEEELLKKIADNLKAEIPQVMIEKRAEDNKNSFSQRIGQQGIDLDTYLMYLGMDRKKFDEDMLEQAKTQVKIQLALEKIAELEGLTASEEEIEEDIKKMAENYGIDVDTIKKIVSEESVAADIKSRKAVEVIAANAKALKPEEKKAGDSDEKKPDEESAEPAPKKSRVKKKAESAE
jgi:trigger factor